MGDCFYFEVLKPVNSGSNHVTVKKSGYIKLNRLAVIVKIVMILLEHIFLMCFSRKPILQLLLQLFEEKTITLLEEQDPSKFHKFPVGEHR